MKVEEGRNKAEDDWRKMKSSWRTGGDRRNPGKAAWKEGNARNGRGASDISMSAHVSRKFHQR